MELKGGGGGGEREAVFLSLALPAFLSSAIPLLKIRGGPRSATDYRFLSSPSLSCNVFYRYHWSFC